MPNGVEGPTRDPVAPERRTVGEAWGDAAPSAPPGNGAICALSSVVAVKGLVVTAAGLVLSTVNPIGGAALAALGGAEATAGLIGTGAYCRGR